jgi:CBS domain-containing protein
LFIFIAQQKIIRVGEQSVNRFSDPVEKRVFTKHLLDDIKALEIMLQESLFEKGIHRIGAEQELVLVNSNWKPSLMGVEILNKIKDEHYTTEIAKFNIEINLDPQEFTKDCFSKMERQLNRLLIKGRKAAQKFDTKFLLTGILPSIRKEDLIFENMTPNPRYKMLNDIIRNQRGGNFELNITGVDELITNHQNILFEACNTSFQVHFQVDADNFVDTYNWAQAVAGPVLAVSANSPLLMGKRLWSETRIALFQQSVDTRNPNSIRRELEPRVGFGKSWLEASPAEIFKDIISRYNIFFSQDIEENSVEAVKSGKVPNLNALKLHNGTVYKWNRACYGISNGLPHLRIENRYIPSGPTVIDEMANSAFWLGLMRSIPEEYKNVSQKMNFEDARYNFYNAARTCLDNHFSWFGKSYPAAELIKKELLPLSRQGLEIAGVKKRDIDRLLEVIEKRVEIHTNGSRWMTKNFSELLHMSTPYEASLNLTKSVYVNESFGAPLHTWNDIDPESRDSHKEFNNVGSIMVTDIATVHEDDLLELVLSIMDWRKTRYIPVENDNHEIVGLITASNLVQHFKFHQDTENFSVKDVMLKNLITISPDSKTSEAVEIMSSKGVGCLPVVSDDGKLLGLVTERSIVMVAKMTCRFD